MGAAASGIFYALKYRGWLIFSRAQVYKWSSSPRRSQPAPPEDSEGATFRTPNIRQPSLWFSLASPARSSQGKVEGLLCAGPRESMRPATVKINPHGASKSDDIGWTGVSNS